MNDVRMQNYFKTLQNSVENRPIYRQKTKPLRYTDKVSKKRKH